APPLSGPAYASPADLQRLVAVTAVAERWDDGLATAAAMTVSDTSNAATQAITTLLFMNLPPLTGCLFRRRRRPSGWRSWGKARDSSPFPRLPQSRSDLQARVPACAGSFRQASNRSS